MIGNVFDFADRVAREVMVPRQDMVCLFLDDTLAENMAVVRSSHHTRYPLCMEDKDQVVGTLHVRDLLKLKPGQTTFDLRRLMRPIVVIPEAMPVPKALHLMQQRHVQMVLVADEYGGTAGLITMEDLVEEIVGDIQDEHEAQEPPDVLQLPDGRIEFDGMVLLDDVAARGTTVLLSSHNLRELEDVCDHVGIMDHGHVLLERSLAQLQDNMVKLQVVFPDGMEDVPAELPVLHASKLGRVHTLIMRMNAQEATERLMAYSPLLVDAIPLTLEEIFIYELGGADYAVKDIVL